MSPWHRKGQLNPYLSVTCIIYVATNATRLCHAGRDVRLGVTDCIQFVCRDTIKQRKYQSFSRSSFEHGKSGIWRKAKRYTAIFGNSASLVGIWCNLDNTTTWNSQNLCKPDVNTDLMNEEWWCTIPRLQLSHLLNNQAFSVRFQNTHSGCSWECIRNKVKFLKEI